MRGRRFVRPALILDHDGASRRVLAELDDKPWAAEEGEPWRAAFRLDAGLEPRTRLELSVAPDINVPLHGSGSAAAAGPSRTPPVQSRIRDDAPVDPVPLRLRGRDRAAGRAAADAPAARAAETLDGAGETGGRLSRRAADAERLSARLAAAESELTGERERRDELEAALERERSEARRAVTELARLRAELEIAHAAESEAAQTGMLLDVARHDGLEAGVRYDALLGEHERLRAEHERVREELRARNDALHSAVRELARERQARDGERASPDADVDPPADRTAGRAARSEPEPETDRDAVRPTRVERVERHAPAPPHRPLNPSLRSGRWLPRLIVLVVLAAFVAAIYVVLHSTVLH